MKDRYGIQRMIATGGMGEVYEVIDAQTGKRRALKTANARYANDKNIIERMVREAHTLAKIESEYLVKVYDAGEDDGQFFMVMELIEGVTLKQLAAERALPLGVTLSVGGKIALGLHVVHRLGHVHRDMKPDNVMIVENVGADEHGAKIIDLGIAKMANTTTTSEGVTLGTVSYMAPEQIRGERVDCRADIYGLGVIMYEMIAGVHPLERNSRPASRDEWRERALRMEPDPLHTVVANLHPAISNLVTRAIAKLPEQRFASAAEFAKQLHALTEMLRASGQLGALPRTERVQRLCQRPRRLREQPHSHGRRHAVSTRAPNGQAVRPGRAHSDRRDCASRPIRGNRRRRSLPCAVCLRSQRNGARPGVAPDSHGATTCGRRLRLSLSAA